MDTLISLCQRGDSAGQLVRSYSTGFKEQVKTPLKVEYTGERYIETVPGRLDGKEFPCWCFVLKIAGKTEVFKTASSPLATFLGDKFSHPPDRVYVLEPVKHVYHEYTWYSLSVDGHTSPLILT